MNEQFFSPRQLRTLRRSALAVVVLVGLGLATGARYRPVASHRYWSPIHGALTSAAIDPIRNKTHESLGGVRRARELWSIDEKNKALRREVARLETSNQLLRQQVDRMERLTGLGQWGGPPEVVFLLADVVGANTYEGSLLIVNRGQRDGIRPSDPVVSLGGLVGVVRSVSEHSAHVQTLTDPLSVVGGIGVGGSGRRSRGMVHGRGQNRPLEFMPENEVQPIDPGALLISSGFRNSVYPKGLVIGVIEERSLDPYGLPYGVVRPAVEMQALEEVLVIVPKSRAVGAGLTPAFTDDPPGTDSLPIEISMPSARARLWSAATSGSLSMIAPEPPTSATLETAMAMAATTMTMEAEEMPGFLPLGTPYPRDVDEPPVPTIESWIERRVMESVGATRSDEEAADSGDGVDGGID